MADERRAGMDDVARAIGGLQAGLAAISQRLGELQTERAAQHVEAIRSLVDVQAQIHEVKHAQSNDAMKFARLEQQLIAHQGQAEKNTNILEQQIVANRTVAETRGETLTARMDDMLYWRNRIYGAVALVMLLLAIFGHEIFELGKSIINGRPHP